MIVFPNVLLLLLLYVHRLSVSIWDAFGAEWYGPDVNLIVFPNVLLLLLLLYFHRLSVSIWDAFGVECYGLDVNFIVFSNVIIILLLYGPSMFAVKAKIYGVLYNRSSSIAFDETSSYWSALKSSLFLGFSVVTSW